MELLKILGKENPADVFTKYVDKSTMDASLAKMCLEFKEGRLPVAPAIMGQNASP